MENYYLNETHSLINEYPVNYNNFPLSKYGKFFEIDLNKDEYLLIPKNWIHWVFTEPKCISLNYTINSIYDTNTNNIIYDYLKKSIPFKGKHKQFNINYEDFVNRSLDYNFTNCLFTKSYHDHAPVKKPNQAKKILLDNKTLRQTLDYFKDKDGYLYILPNLIEKNNIYYPEFIDVPNFNNINELKLQTDIHLWINFDKSVQMGLHYDVTDNILYVIEGKKKIFLLPPKYNSITYFSNTCTIHKDKIIEFLNSNKSDI